MDFLEGRAETAGAIAEALGVLSADCAPMPMTSLDAVAHALGVSRLHAKDEGARALGSFKSLGGTYAGLRALARHAGEDVSVLLAKGSAGRELPMLICASDGNHGLAVAAAARHAGSGARAFLHSGVPENRARRIAEMGAQIQRVAGTYDDAVDAAAATARAGEGILVADTSEDENDPVVAEVMAGYGVIAHEARRQFDEAKLSWPTHLFVQAGVGGLAAVMADGMRDWMAAPAQIVVVESIRLCPGRRRRPHALPLAPSRPDRHRRVRVAAPPVDGQDAQRAPW